jgi:hypothetical protein
MAQASAFKTYDAIGNREDKKYGYVFSNSDIIAS